MQIICTKKIVNAFKSILPRNLETNVSDESEDLESEPSFEERIAERTKMRRQKKSDEENQEGQGLKILTPDQMLSRLPITLSQLKSGNSSENFKFFVSSKKLTKSIYKHLINII